MQLSSLVLKLGTSQSVSRSRSLQEWEARHAAGTDDGSIGTGVQSGADRILMLDGKAARSLGLEKDVLRTMLRGRRKKI